MISDLFLVAFVFIFLLKYIFLDDENQEEENYNHEDNGSGPKEEDEVADKDFSAEDNKVDNRDDDEIENLCCRKLSKDWWSVIFRCWYTGIAVTARWECDVMMEVLIVLEDVSSSKLLMVKMSQQTVMMMRTQLSME